MVLLSVVTAALGSCADDDGSNGVTGATTPPTAGDDGDSGGGTASDDAADPDSSSSGGGATGDDDPGATGDSGSTGDQWGFTLSGAVEGGASGHTLVINVPGGNGSVVFNAASLSEDGGLDGIYNVARGDELGEKMALGFSVHLPDGMTCSSDVGQMLWVTIDVLDGSMESYDATFSGPVLCDNGSEAMVEGFLRQL